jgi:hypothetical protein
MARASIHPDPSETDGSVTWVQHVDLILSGALVRSATGNHDQGIDVQSESIGSK